MSLTTNMRGSRRGGDSGSGSTTLKITSGYSFPKKYWYGPPREAIGLKGSNCFSGEVRNSVIYVNDKQQQQNAVGNP